MAYSVTDEDVLKAATYRLLENGDADATGTSLITPTWTIAKLVAWANDAQMRFLKETSLIQSRASIAATPQVQRYALPADSISCLRVTWTDADGNISQLSRSDAFQLDAAMNDWESDYAAPIIWQESTTPTLAIDIAKAPSDIGSISVLYVALSTVLTGLGVVLSIPDEFSPAVTWLTLGSALAADGEGCDPIRAAYCESRFDEYVELARVTLRSLGVH